MDESGGVLLLGGRKLRGDLSMFWYGRMVRG